MMVHPFASLSISRCKIAFLSTIASLCAVPVTAQGQDGLCAPLDGATIVNNDGEYIGRISGIYDTDSIFNQYGKFGSQYRAGSIWNQYGKNGSEYRNNSAFNPYSLSPPKVIKNNKVIAVLSVNKNLRGAINPVLLGTICYDFKLPR